MIWKELTIHTTEEAVEMVSNFLHEAGAGGVTMDIDEVIAEVRARIEELKSFDIDPGAAEISVRDVSEDDWANNWKQYFKPLRVSERLTIKPTWEEYVPVTPNEQIIELDPGMAFGTGTHPTTSLCLRTLESIIQEGDEVIDVGTGSGILAIGACRLGASKVLALDLDPVAVSSAKENTRLNGLEDRIQVVESDLLSVLKGEGSTDVEIKLPVRVVVANILAEIILLFIEDVYQALAPGGYYIASGIYKNKEQAVQEALIAAGFELERTAREEDWVAFVARKR